MENHQMSMKRAVSRRYLRTALGLTAAGLLGTAAVALAEPVAISGESSTVFRMGQGSDRKDYYPVYEYLQLSADNLSKDGGLSFHFGGWGRVDLADKTRNRSNDGDLRYGYLTYQHSKNNLVVSAGRQFIAEGVMTQKFDGLYLRSDLAGGFGAAAFVGAPVVTEPNEKGGSFVYGGRVTHTLGSNYTIGVSALQTREGNGRFREEEGVDVWAQPIKQISLAGRSSYNSMTSGWMEHTYSLSYLPSDRFRMSADVSNVNYKDFFYGATTSAFRMVGKNLDPNEKLLSLGGTVAYQPIGSIALLARYTNNSYDIAKTAHYYGAGLTYSGDKGYSAGASVYRMDGQVKELQYTEARLYAGKKFDKFDLALDLINLFFDKKVNGEKNAFTAIAAASYRLTNALKLTGDVDYSRNPEFKNELKGLVKLSYAFDFKP